MFVFKDLNQDGSGERCAPMLYSLPQVRRHGLTSGKKTWSIYIGCQISLAPRPPDQTKNHPDLSYAAFERPFQYELLGQVSDLCHNFLYFKFNAFKIMFCVKNGLKMK